LAGGIADFSGTAGIAWVSFVALSRRTAGRLTLAVTSAVAGKIFSLVVITTT